MTPKDLTIVICARDAAGTVARAAASVSVGGLLVVDDGSSDDTAAEASRGARVPIRILRLSESRGLGHARRMAVEAVETPYLAWLDADDEYAPGRVEAMMPLAEAGADLVFDAALLLDGASGAAIRVVPVPDFLQRPGGMLRTFERNYLPGSAWPLARTAFVRRVGFDSGQTSAEDLDFLLRALRDGGRIEAVDHVGYRQYHYASSLSRNTERHSRLVSRALAKHDYEEVHRLFLREGYPDRVAQWALVSMALFRDDYREALARLDHACPAGVSRDDILEPDGPSPLPEGWREGFARGTLLCLLGDCEAAIPHFERAAAYQHLLPPAGAAGVSGSPDLYNNWAVALAAAGRAAEAHDKVVAAAALLPGYADAARNADAPVPSRLTRHPLRRQPSRREYR